MDKPKQVRIDLWVGHETKREIEILKRAWRLTTTRAVIERALLEKAREERGVGK